MKRWCTKFVTEPTPYWAYPRSSKGLTRGEKKRLHMARCGQCTLRNYCEDGPGRLYRTIKGAQLAAQARREQERMTMTKVYDAKGSAHGCCSDQSRIPFAQVQKGQMFKQSGRYLIKTSTIHIIDRSYPVNEDGSMNMKKFNAVQITGKPGSKSCISDDTAVQVYPDAAVYLQG